MNKKSKNAVDIVRAAGIFDPGYLDGLRVVTFDGNEPSDGVSNLEDFIYGRTTDFVGIHSRAGFEAIDPKQVDDRRAVALILAELPTYDESVAHEIAHNVFDIEYAKRFGGYVDDGGIPEISAEYSDQMRAKLSGMIKEQYPNLDLNKFEFNRQQVCEIFAMLYEREFGKRQSDNNAAHEAVAGNCQRFMADPESELARFNAETGRNCTMEDFYSENHVLSLIATPLIEERYPDFGDRLAVFWE
ncbi:MAG: hypothetical protein WCI79_02930 [Candidatus Saccharibacteria bacterium]